MKRIVSDVVGFPNGCETVRFTACFVSMLMRADGITSDKQCNLFCAGQDDNGVCCGQCGEVSPIRKKHEELYNLYTAVTGFGFLQLDLSDDGQMSEGWNQVCNVLLRQLDWYIGFTMDYAGYDFKELIFPDNNKEEVFCSIKESIDRDLPVLALFGRKYSWVLVTGYDDDGVLYGLDGSQGYWGKPSTEAAGYDKDGLFIMPDWYEKAGHAFILGDKKEKNITLGDVFSHGITIMEEMKCRGYYKNSAHFMRDDSNFEGLTDDELLKLRDRISGFIGQPIDQRAVLGCAMRSLAVGAKGREAMVYRLISEQCSRIHDVLWIAWRAIGEFMDGDPLQWARGLQNKVIRNMIADCFDIVWSSDEMILKYLKEVF